MELRLAGNFQSLVLWSSAPADFPNSLALTRATIIHRRLQTMTKEKKTKKRTKDAASSKQRKKERKEQKKKKDKKRKKDRKRKKSSSSTSNADSTDSSISSEELRRALRRSLRDEKKQRRWRTPSSVVALPKHLGKVISPTPKWFNDARSGCRDATGRQEGSTCGIFAVNHILHSASLLGSTNAEPFHKDPFEALALAKCGDAPKHLVDPGGSNYDIAVLHVNLQAAGLLCHPLHPELLQKRVADPWAKHQPEGAAPQEPIGYIFRTPQAGGHWIAILPPSAMGAKSTEGNAMVLCDSLRKFPYALKVAEMEMLMTSCAAVGAAGKTSWAAFLATKEPQGVSDGAKDSEATAIAGEFGEGTMA